ncbi:MAG: hypothetical protein WCW77_03305 [Patescibacteria group bacterium]|jgi:hypothetical protein
MDFVIDLSTVVQFFSLPVHEILLKIFFGAGWLPLFILYLFGARTVWLYYIQLQYARAQKYVFLAIDVPRGNEQSPLAVENIFNYLAGAHMTINVFERWWMGEWQLRFSMEIVSIDGYIQYVIRSPLRYRDLVESAIYSQYPDAEITEIDDYTRDTPDRFPDEAWDLVGTEFTYTKPAAYPIKTYKKFEVAKPGIDEKSSFKDPNGTLMALMSSLGPGEQMWYQILLQPIGFDWMGIADDEVKKIFGEEVGKKGIGETLIALFLQALHDLSEAIYKLWGDIEDEKKKEEKKVKTMIELNPAEKKRVEAIQEKVSKVAYNTKIRFIYLAKKELFHKGKSFGGFVGYMKQFVDNDLNSLRPDMELTMTRAHYFFVDERRNLKKYKIMKGYKGRDGAIGKLPIIMNVEELATLWHFPLESAVNAPLLQKAPGRKAEAPMGLPIHSEGEVQEKIEFFEDIRPEPGISFQEEKPWADEEERRNEKEDKAKHKGEAPENLPFA